MTDTEKKELERREKIIFDIVKDFTECIKDISEICSDVIKGYRVLLNSKYTSGNSLLQQEGAFKTVNIINHRILKTLKKQGGYLKELDNG